VKRKASNEPTALLSHQDQAHRVGEPVCESFLDLVTGGWVTELGEERSYLMCIAGFGFADSDVGIPAHGNLVCSVCPLAATRRLAGMRLGVIADIHGNDVALRAVLEDADQLHVDRWWALGDLVLFGPRPAEALELLQGLPYISMLRGNGDRYVLTGEQPAPHSTAADAAASIGLVERHAAMAAGIGWTRGVLDQAGLINDLAALPTQLRLESPSGATVLGVHASPRADDGQGIEPNVADEVLRALLAGCDAEVVIGGHTHLATDRLVDGIRALNPGSTGLPDPCGAASWLLFEDDGDALAVAHRSTPFDVDEVVSDLARRRHPNAEFVTAILTGQREQIRASSST
jgi:predicted phosphodiesterase